MTKKKLTWKDLSLDDFKVYFFSLFKAFIPKKKIKNFDELKKFIQMKSAWVSQVTLYSYLKTRMGTRYVLLFENDEFMKSVNTAKWNIYAVALQDLTFFSFSYLKAYFNYQETDKAKEIFFAGFKEIPPVSKQTPLPTKDSGAFLSFLFPFHSSVTRNDSFILPLPTPKRECIPSFSSCSSL